MRTDSSSPLVVSASGATSVGWVTHDELLVLHNGCKDLCMQITGEMCTEFVNAYYLLCSLPRTIVIN